MKRNILFQRKGRFGFRGQAIVEFAIALPILFALLIGLMEVGRMVLMYALVTNASRDAARYASAVGLDDSGVYPKYTYCTGIKSTAMSSAYFLKNSITVTVTYDTGTLPSSPADSCAGGVTTATTTPAYGDRVTVFVSATYTPIVKLIPIGQRTFKASSSRTILGITQLQN
jgi:Flp pilus assembly protein TadG